MTYIIVPATPQHTVLLRRNLRQKDLLEIQASGFTPRKAIWQSYKNSFLNFSGFVDGEIAAMWGIGGTILGAVGEPWLFTTPLIEKVPVAFIREARAWIRRALHMFPRLAGYVQKDYTEAVRLLEVLGFDLGPEFIFPGGRVFIYYSVEH